MLSVTRVSVQVGFLKIQHKYEIVFTLPEVPALGKDVCPAPVPNPHLRVTDVKLAPEGTSPVTRHPSLGPQRHSWDPRTDTKRTGNTLCGWYMFSLF